MSSDRPSARSRRKHRRFLTRFVPVSLMLLAGILLLVALGAYTASAAPVFQAAGEGKAIFEAKCAGCHSIGGGDLVGPDLAGVTGRRDPQWLRDFIADPASMIASDPDAKKLAEAYGGMTMPNMGLSSADLDAVLAYLNEPGAGPAGPAVPAGTGDPAAGRLLFTGETALANGGPACIACHSATGTGDLGGGALGPDLTHATARLGEQGLAASLKTIAFPTMAGPFENRPLTDKELADLVAFLKETDRTQAPVPVTAAGALTTNALLIFALGLAGAGLLFALLLFLRARRERTAERLPVRKL